MKDESIRENIRSHAKTEIRLPADPLPNSIPSFFYGLPMLLCCHVARLHGWVPQWRNNIALQRAVPTKV